MDAIETKIQSLIAKAEKADKSEDAMRFSQAANNAANTLATLDHSRRQGADDQIKKLADWIMANRSDAILGESAVDTAIAIMSSAD